MLGHSHSVVFLLSTAVLTLSTQDADMATESTNRTIHLTAKLILSAISLLIFSAILSFRLSTLLTSSAGIVSQYEVVIL